MVLWSLHFRKSIPFWSIYKIININTIFWAMGNLIFRIKSGLGILGILMVNHTYRKGSPLGNSQKYRDTIMNIKIIFWAIGSLFWT